jgi:hypothetical protein
LTLDRMIFTFHWDEIGDLIYQVRRSVTYASAY